MLYSPKRIVSGVDLTVHRPLVVVPGEVAVFSGALIHGAAENRFNGVRFSVDFRLIASQNLTVSKESFASGKQYFEGGLPLAGSRRLETERRAGPGSRSLSLLRSPLPRRLTSVRMHAYPLGLGLRLLVNA